MAEEVIEQQEVAKQRPEGLPENFESIETLVSSHKEAQDKIRQQGELLSTYESQLGELYSQMQELQTAAPAPSYDLSVDPIVQAYEKAMEEGDYRSALAISHSLDRQAARLDAEASAGKIDDSGNNEAWAFMATQHAAELVGDEEWRLYKERVFAESQNENFEGLSAVEGGKKLARIYKMVKADDVLGEQKTRSEAQAEAERLAKLKAQTMTGASGREPEPMRDDVEIERIKRFAKEGSYTSLLRPA